MGMLILIIVIGAAVMWSLGRVLDSYEQTRDYAAIQFAQANFDKLVAADKGLITRESLRSAAEVHSGEERKLIDHMRNHMDRFGHSIGTEQGVIPMSSPFGYAMPIVAEVHVYGITREDLAKARSQHPDNVPHW